MMLRTCNACTQQVIRFLGVRDHQSLRHHRRNLLHIEIAKFDMLLLTRCLSQTQKLMSPPKAPTVQLTGHEARQPDSRLIALIAKAQDWFSQLRSGKADSIQAIAQSENVTGSYVTRVIYLAFLSPDIVEAIVAGKHPPTLSAQRLIQSVPLPLRWYDQRAVLGFDKL